MRLKSLLALSAAAFAAASCAPASRQPSLHQLPNGAALILLEDSSADIIALHVLLKGSRFMETEASAGITRLMASIWPRGTDDMTSGEISEAFDSLGARFGISVHPDFTAVSLKTAGSEFAEAFGLFCRVLLSPSFPEEEFEREKEQQLSAVRRKRDNLFDYAYEHFKDAFYPGHPYGLPELGSPDSVAGLSREDVASLHRILTEPGGMVIACVGNFSAESMGSLVKSHFPGAPGAPLSAARPACSAPPQTGVIKVAADSLSSWILIGFPAPPVGSGDFAAIKVLNAALGSGMSSRLFLSVREELGLAYSAGSFYPARVECSHLLAYAVCEPAHADDVIRVVLDEIDGIRKRGLCEEELARAKNFIRGQHLFSLETFSGRAWHLAWFELIGRGFEYAYSYPREIEQVSSSGIKKAAAEYLSEPVIVLLGPESPRGADCPAGSAE